ncbi:dTDP-L-rhamnose 4-epimerase [Octadecabacter temperatus]|uniref:dTDP-L-rhamnose 4-epimerase n=1 Tax=Octadecabacter temperatus TaxID=1458307 RepID=A0A0K0YA92_9RHOB|nr:NAD-dependent epimerase/dehydratase family protein [Octadecabacter temperatus]AKS47845.1 dTDP-L-rhamnose 4-epimerase [Octadecabacter temperatus]SIO48311.1 dTDP-L-rhamnose 4-epimerase [Octadecabacter temperatus]
MTTKPSKILITGGAGFIGSRLALNLKQNGAEVTVYDNLHPQAHDGNPANLASLEQAAVPVIKGDVCDLEALQSALETVQPEVIYHLAAETGTGQSFDLPTRYCNVNVIGTTNLIEAVRATKSVTRVVLAGSRSVYGEGACVDENGAPTKAVERSPSDLEAGDFAVKDHEGGILTPVPTDASTCPVAPASVYASSKLMQEYLLTQAFWNTDVKVGILRLQNVYGPGQSLNNPYTGVLSIFARQIQEGRVLEIYEDGDITRDFVYVDDVVRAFAAFASVATLPDRIVDIGLGQGATILEIARKMLVSFGEDAMKYRISGAFRPGDIRYGVADISAAKSQLEWAPQHSLENGLAALVAWSKTVHTRPKQEA